MSIASLSPAATSSPSAGMSVADWTTFTVAVRSIAVEWSATPEAIRREAIPVGWEAVVVDVLTALAGLRRQVVLCPRARHGVARILETAME